MSESNVITAGIIIIGNEILSGRVQELNLQHIAQKLNKLGVYIREARVIPDIEESIIETVLYFHGHYDYVFTTGGIGPTHDDITAVSISKAFQQEVEFNEEVMELLKVRYGDLHLTEGRKNMARMPKGAKLIKNPVTSVPGFQIENVFVMAGIPDVMHGMLDYALENIVPGRSIISSAIHCHLAEGDLAGGLREIQNQNMDVDIGSYPFWKQGRFGTSIVIRGQDPTLIDRTMGRVEKLILALGGEPEIES
jgi:molybdenum cofactor synthesis domain-containing protein